MGEEKEKLAVLSDVSDTSCAADVHICPFLVIPDLIGNPSLSPVRNPFLTAIIW